MPKVYFKHRLLSIGSVCEIHEQSEQTSKNYQPWTQNSQVSNLDIRPNK